MGGKISQKNARGYHFEGAANANIFCFMTAKSRAACSTIDRLGYVSCETILTLSSIILTGVCGETDDAGDVDCEYEGSGVSGVVGGVRYAFAGCVGIDGGGGVDFGGEA